MVGLIFTLQNYYYFHIRIAEYQERFAFHYCFVKGLEVQALLFIYIQLSLILFEIYCLWSKLTKVNPSK